MPNGQELDRNNVASKGRVFHENDEIVMLSEKEHILDQEQIRMNMVLLV